MRRAVAGALQLALIGCIVGGLSVPVVYLVGHWRGQSAAKAERDAHYRSVIDKLLADARAAVQARDADVKRVHDTITKERDDAQERLARESTTVRALRGDLARAGREHDRLRDQLAAAAAGGVAEADDSVTACRARADAIGGVLAEVLRDARACALEAEDLANGSRTLQQYARRVHELSQAAP